MVIIGWVLFVAAALFAVGNVEASIRSHRGLQVRVVGGPPTLLAALSVLADAATVPMVIPIALIDLLAAALQKRKR